MEKKKKVEWYNNGNTITSLIIGMILLIIICSQSFANTHGSSLELFSSIINHNSVYLFILVYFVFLKLEVGKKYFNYSNVLLIFIYCITTLTSFLTVIQSFSLNTTLDFVLNISLLTYLVHTLFRDTRVWKEFHIDKSPFNELTNEFSYYCILVICVFLLIVNLISTVVVSGVVIALLDTIYYLLFSRYIYLYREYLDKHKLDSKNSGNFDGVRDKIDEVLDKTEIDEKIIEAKDKLDKKIEDTSKKITKSIDDFVEKNELDKKADELEKSFEDGLKDVKKKVTTKKSTKTKKGDK